MRCEYPQLDEPAGSGPAAHGSGDEPTANPGQVYFNRIVFQTEAPSLEAKRRMRYRACCVLRDPIEEIFRFVGKDLHVQTTRPPRGRSHRDLIPFHPGPQQKLLPPVLFRKLYFAGQIVLV